MGNEQSSENGCPSLTGPEAVLVDPSTILCETQQEISMRTQIAAQSSTANTLSVNPDRAGHNGENQLREAVLEILDILNPLALFPSTFIDGDEETLPPAQALAQFEATSGYINFLLMIKNICIKPT